ncbi:MAG: alpha/beta fold hydrolase [Pseudomonadota bacterium]
MIYVGARWLLAVLFLCLSSLAYASDDAAQGSELYTKSYGSEEQDDTKTLIFVLHGDAPFAPPSYHYAFARKAAEQIPNSRIIAILRPGYSDGLGNQSAGKKGMATGDNYTADRIAAIAEVIAAERQKYPGSDAVIVGHSGGAAIAANLAALYPQLVDSALLVSCPCVLDQWREHMLSIAPDAPFDQPVTSINPLNMVERINQDKRITIMVGEDDQVTPSSLSKLYYDRLKQRSVAAHFFVLADKDHEMLNSWEVLSMLTLLVGNHD